MDLNQIIAFNVKYLAKSRNMKIGDIEKQCGVRTGYFSIHAAGHIESMPVQIVRKLAQIFDVSMDELCDNIRLKEMIEYLDECGYDVIPKSMGCRKECKL